MNNNSEKRRIPFLWVIRFFFILLFTLIYFKWGIQNTEYIHPDDLPFYYLIGFLIASVLVFIESQVQYAFPQELMIGLFGLLCGLAASSLVQIGIPESEKTEFLRMMLHLFLGYFGIVIALRYAHRFDFTSFATKIITRSEDIFYGAKFLDTSILIDGRIIEIIESRFLEGLLVVPNFVVNELQILADSDDHMKRTRGRRGMDILRRLQSNSKLQLEMLDEDFPNLHGVDKKLIALTKKYNGTLVTMDYNLAKVAEIEDLATLNINQLAQSLKTVLLPGEEISLQIIREGKEHNQGVGYLDDGTMVVVENGRKLINKTIPIAISSVLQTSAGRLVFAKPKEIIDDHSNHEKAELNQPSGKYIEWKTGESTESKHS